MPETTGSLTNSNFQLFSHKKPSLPSGKNTLDVRQIIAPPDDPSHSIELKGSKKITVTAPRFSLNPSEDVHSVYPPQGHSDYSNTLAHIVLSSPMAPWERSPSAKPWKGDPSGVNINTTPWLALLVFVEDELALNSAWLKDRGLPTQSETFSFATTPEILQVATGIANPFRANPDGTFPLNLVNPKESIQAILLKSALFKALFGDYTEGASTPTWNGKASLERYDYLAHVKKVFNGSKSEANEYSVVLSHRTGPPQVSSPTSVVAHLVSLEGLDEMHIGNNHSHVALVSLYSWNWTCIPSNETNLIHPLQGLGTNIQPLRASDKKLATQDIAAVKTGEHEPKSSTDSTRVWLHQKLKEGYVLKKHTLPTGESTTALFRGPLSPVLPATVEQGSIKPSSLFGTDLQILDTKVGIVDTSYNTAWQLGKVSAMGNRSFIMSLLQLRGNIHSESSNVTKAALDDTHLSTTQFLSSLRQATSTTATAHDPTPLTNHNMAARRCKVPVQGLTSQHPLVQEQYMKQLALNDSDFAPGKALYNDFQYPKNPNWAIVMKWVLDKLFIDIPHHYLITDPDHLPPESIRTFYIDSVWLEALIDGALSHGNHFDREDDVIRRALKENVNQYLCHAVNGTQPQLPRWGFLLRSSVVNAFPDLRVNAPWPEGQKEKREILLIKKITDDTIMCLLGRHPEEGTLKSITISQPAHPQRFSCGVSLDDNELQVEFRSLGNQPGASDDMVGHSLGLRTWRSLPKESDHPQPQIYDWTHRTLILPSFAKRCVDELTKAGIFEWKQSDPCPSSIIGAQLTAAAFKLKIDVDVTVRHSDSSNNHGTWTALGSPTN